MPQLRHPDELLTHPLLRDLPSEARGRLLEALRPVVLDAGDALFNAGEEADAIYLVEQGYLDVLSDEGTLLTVLGPGGLLGELAMLLGSRRTARVVASTDALLWRLAMDEARSLASKHPPIALAFGRSTAARVAAADKGSQGAAPPRVQVVITAASLSDTAAIEAALSELLRRRGALFSVPELDRCPPERVEQVRALGRAMAASRELLLWTRPGAPSWQQSLRNADRVVVLGDDRLLAAVLPDLPEQAPVLLATLDPAGGGSLSMRRGSMLLPLPQGPDRAADLLLEELVREGGVLGVIGRIPELARVSPVCRSELARAMRVETHLAGAPIFRAGEPSGVAYLVLSGRVQERRADDRSRVEHGPGDLLGLMQRGGARERETTAVPQRDSTLASLDSSSLERLCTRFPTLQAALAERWVSRSMKAPRAAAPEQVSLTLLCTGSARVWQARVQAVQEALGGRSACRIIDRELVEQCLGSGAADAAPGSALASRVGAWLAMVEERTGSLLYVCDDASPVWRDRCVRQADHVLVFVEPCSGRVLAEPLPPADTWSAPRHLVLWWPGAIQPGQTTRWLSRFPGLPWHHVRGGEPSDVARMTRRVLGRAVGLTLGGASSRGIAHLGVAAAICERGLPIDCVVGTSIGAMFAAVVAQQRPLDEGTGAALQLRDGFSVSWDNLNLPLSSLLSGRRVTRLYQRFFGDVLIEDLAIPLRITAVDLRSGEQVVIDRGPIWQAVRSSTSIPAIWPPVAADGRLLIDGGLMDNFPYWVLQSECHRGLQVISNLDSGYSTPYPDAPEYGPHLSGARVLRDVLRRRVRYPRLLGTVIESLVLGGRASSRDLEARVDPNHVLVVRPEVPRLGIFELRDHAQGREMVETAWQHTAARLEEWARGQVAVG